MERDELKLQVSRLGAVHLQLGSDVSHPMIGSIDESSNRSRFLADSSGTEQEGESSKDSKPTGSKSLDRSPQMPGRQARERFSDTEELFGTSPRLLNIGTPEQLCSGVPGRYVRR